jgi:hypothetical protein
MYQLLQSPVRGWLLRYSRFALHLLGQLLCLESCGWHRLWEFVARLLRVRGDFVERLCNLTRKFGPYAIAMLLTLAVFRRLSKWRLGV